VACGKGFSALSNNDRIDSAVGDSHHAEWNQQCGQRCFLPDEAAQVAATLTPKSTSNHGRSCEPCHFCSAARQPYRPPGRRCLRYVAQANHGWATAHFMQDKR
jgi:hypothetical protein